MIIYYYHTTLPVTQNDSFFGNLKLKFLHLRHSKFLSVADNWVDRASTKVLLNNRLKFIAERQLVLTLASVILIYSEQKLMLRYAPYISMMS